jgi:2,3-dihydroxyphenylpropionate 1,2-dioxygenase
MSTIVAGICASHHTGMNWAAERTKAQDLVKHFQDGLAAASEILHDAEPDVAVVVGSNHFQGVYLEMMPAFMVGVGECVGDGTGGTPKGPLLIDTDYARKLSWGLTERHFDLAISARLEVDHGITIGMQHLWPSMDLPMVPIVINTFAAPLPTMTRCRDLGVAIRSFIESDGEAKRVAILASGGLSHNLPFFPKWYSTANEEEDQLVDLGMYPRDEDGAERWARKRGEIISRSQHMVNPEFDEGIMRMLLERDWASLLRYTDAEIDEIAGNGAQEIRNWIVAAGAVEGSGKQLAYAPLTEWHTGMAVATLI